ncbi:DUF3261 domain-containing protein [Simiduia litorea]|uniref:DUF3261 domain-containing protein n=1 Tax=Simiduia litorea TaxID=1435348 RepID=UPI0036F423D2
MSQVCRWIIALCLSALVACAQLKRPALAAIDLAEPSSLGQQVQVTQQVDITWQGNEHQLLVVWSQQDDLLQVLGMTATGQLLFRANAKGTEFSQQTFVPELAQLDLKQLLQHIQIAYWPAAKVAELLAKNKMQLDLVAADTMSRQRLVRRGDRVLARYLFANDEVFSSVRIAADEQPSLTVTTLTVQPLDASQHSVQPMAGTKVLNKKVKQ